MAPLRSVRLLPLLVAAACVAQAPPCPRCPDPTPRVEAPRPPQVTTLEGEWRGVLAGQLHLALRVAKQGDRTVAILDSIDQGAKLPVDVLTLDGSKVHFTIAAVGGMFAGTLEGTTLRGTWTQRDIPQPLTFERTAAVAEVKLPAPRKPLDAPVDVAFVAAPSPLVADDHTHLVYELVVTSWMPCTLVSVEVNAGGHTLSRLEGDALKQATSHPSGALTVVFVWLTLDGPAPHTLEHRVGVRVGEEDRTVTVPVPVHDLAPVILGPPVRGGSWRAVNGPSNGSLHRRALMPIGGRAHDGQRFAIDWVKLGADGKTFAGDPASNASYHAYGADALAVADGTVVAVQDGIAENVPRTEDRAVPITLETVGGNHVVVDLGHGAFGFWAHLQPGSLRVKVGDHVRRGTVLGKVGNSGNSTEPHLHFHVMDGPAPLGSEGIPYAFDAFEVAKGGSAAVRRTKQLPTEGEDVSW